MKLLFCPECWDIVKLATHLKSCRCGLCRGQYYEGNHKAVVNGRGMSLGIDNMTLKKAYYELTLGIDATPQITMWARPHDGKLNPNTEVKKDL